MMFAMHADLEIRSNTQHKSTKSPMAETYPTNKAPRKTATTKTPTKNAVAPKKPNTYSLFVLLRRGLPDLLKLAHSRQHVLANIRLFILRKPKGPVRHLESIEPFDGGCQPPNEVADADLVSVWLRTPL
jgi:hypothetical protein